jgi:esterase/lipase
VFDSLAGPKELAFFADSGHLSFIGKHPDEWKARVHRFLDHVPPVTPRP